MDASQITKLLQKQNTRYINRCQAVDSSTLIWQNQIQSSKYIKGVKTCDGAQNTNVPTNPCCADQIVINGVVQNTGTYSFGGSGRTTSIQTGSPQQFLNVLSGGAGSASEVYSSERILLQQAGKESCGVPGVTPITTTTTDACGNTVTTTTNNTYITLPACYCDNTNGPMDPRYNIIGQNPGVAEWATRIGSSDGSDERILSMVSDNQGNIYVAVYRTGGGSDQNVVISNYTSVSSGRVSVTTYGTIPYSPSTNNYYLVKYNSSGQAQWATRIDNIISSDNDGYIPGITIDECGNLYLAGTSTTGNAVTPRQVTFYNANTQNPNGGAIIQPLYGTMDIQSVTMVIVVKYNPAGQIVAVNKINAFPENVFTSTLNQFKGISYSSGGIYLTFWGTTNPVGYPSIMFYNSATPGAPILPSTATINPTQWGKITPTVIGEDAYIVKFNTSLNPEWATIVGNISGTQKPYSLTTDQFGNVYAAIRHETISSASIQVPSFISPPATPGGEINLTPVLSRATLSIIGNSSIIVKYSSSGQVSGVAYIRDTNNDTNNTIIITSMTIDSSNNLCITGVFGGRTGAQTPGITINNFINITGTTINTSVFGNLALTGTPNTNFNIMVIKFNSSLQGIWVTKLSSTYTNGIQGPNSSITVDNSNNIYITGRYVTSNLLINNFSGITGTTINVSSFGALPFVATSPVYLVKYNSDGTAQWATQINDVNRTGANVYYPIITDSNYNIYIGGSYEGTGTNPNKIITINNYGSLLSGVVSLNPYAAMTNTNTNDSFLIKYAQPPILQEIPFPVNNQSNPYLPPFDTYYAMKNPQCNYPVQDQNQKHFVKECNTRFPNANNGVNAVFSPCNNVTELDPDTKKFYTTTQDPPSCEGCIIQQ